DRLQGYNNNLAHQGVSAAIENTFLTYSELVQLVHMIDDMDNMGICFDFSNLNFNVLQPGGFEKTGYSGMIYIMNHPKVISVHAKQLSREGGAEVFIGNEDPEGNEAYKQSSLYVRRLVRAAQGKEIVLAGQKKQLVPSLEIIPDFNTLNLMLGARIFLNNYIGG
ncbi:MAG: hypothetical protein U9O94_01890, partial [Nanoarchaeota archaeon]|nr:hypothetical protein [Nanoarchaeota archaeon]